MRALLALCRGRGLRGQNRIATLALLLPLLIFEEQRRPGPAQMPLHVVSQHAQKNVRGHAILRAMPNRPHQQIHPFQTAESSLHFRQALVAPHRLFRRKPFGRLAGAHHINPIQFLFLLNRWHQTIPGKAALADFALKVLAHFVPPSTFPTFTPISFASSSFFFRRATSLLIFCKLFSVASSNACLLRLRSSSRNGL